MLRAVLFGVGLYLTGVVDAQAPASHIDEDEITDKGLYIGLCIGGAVLLCIILGLIICFMKQAVYRPPTPPPPHYANSHYNGHYGNGHYGNGNAYSNPQSKGPGSVDRSNITVRGPLVPVAYPPSNTQLGMAPFVAGGAVASTRSSLHQSGHQSLQHPGHQPQHHPPSDTYALVDGSGHVTMMSGLPGDTLPHPHPHPTMTSANHDDQLPDHYAPSSNPGAGDQQSTVTSAQIHGDPLAPRDSASSFIPGSSTLAHPTPGTSRSSQDPDPDPELGGSGGGSTGGSAGGSARSVHTASDLEQEEMLVEMSVHHQEHGAANPGNDSGNNSGSNHGTTHDENPRNNQEENPGNPGNNQEENPGPPGNNQGSANHDAPEPDQARTGDDDEENLQIDVEWEENEMYQAREDLTKP